MSKFLVEEFETHGYNPNTGEEYSYSGQKSVQLKKIEPFFLTPAKQILAVYSTEVLNATPMV